ncbi:hypothetical protein GCM10022247_09880 [Allokutzneria multivorans]|uniref:Tetratricopeptide repeat protein n=1 Tax=Allokutzneria multivorans TaxID=1142134 RepID=A0ABP7R7D1_9PSEU
MTNSETLAYHKQLLDYQVMGFDAAKNGDFETAIQIWTNILNDAPTREFFEQSREALMEIAWNLATVHYANGDADTSRTIFEQWGFPPSEFEKVLAGEGEEQ